MSGDPSNQREGVCELFDELEVLEAFTGALLGSLLFGIRWPSARAG